MSGTLTSKRSNKRVGKGEPHANGQTNHGYRVDKTSDQEHLALQHGASSG